MTKVKKSVVWKFFVNTINGDATCKICNRSVRSGGKGGGTTNLRNHLKRNHPDNKKVISSLEETEEREDSNKKS